MLRRAEDDAEKERAIQRGEEGSAEQVKGWCEKKDVAEKTKKEQSERKRMEG
jgi:hypothetical protein